jgi:hypothetical protein
MNDGKHRFGIPENRPQRLVLRIERLLRICGKSSARLNNLLPGCSRIGALPRAQARDAIGKCGEGIADRRMRPALKPGP